MKLFLILLMLPVLAFGEELKVLTWNTFLIPVPWNFTKQNPRAKIMYKTLPDLSHDVMFFQEAFHDKHRKKLIQLLKDTHPYSAAPVKGNKIYQIQDSGLFIVSKHPMTVLDQVIFDQCTNTDCMSSKSAILVEITLPSGSKLHMVNTHLQAWDKPKAIAIRKIQLEQIKIMMSKHFVAGIPQVLVGDLNIDGKLPTEYNEALALMDMTSTPLEGDISGTNGFPTKGCFKKPGEDNEEWLDHFWVKANGSVIAIENKKVLPLTGKLFGKICPLSDHNAVEAVIKL